MNANYEYQSQTIEHLQDKYEEVRDATTEEVDLAKNAARAVMELDKYIVEMKKRNVAKAFFKLVKENYETLCDMMPTDDELELQRDEDLIRLQCSVLGGVMGLREKDPNVVADSIREATKRTLEGYDQLCRLMDDNHCNEVVDLYDSVVLSFDRIHSGEKTAQDILTILEPEFKEVELAVF